MDRQIIKIGPTVVNLDNVTHAEFESVTAEPGVRRSEAEDFKERVMLWVNATEANAAGVPIQQKLVFDGEDAELLRKYFDRLAFGLRKRSSNHASD